MKKQFIFLSLAGMLIGSPFSTHGQVGDEGILERREAVLFALDISGSMEGDPLRHAQATIQEVTNKSPRHLALGLISFSGCSHDLIRVEVPIGKDNREQMSARI